MTRKLMANKIFGAKTWKVLVRKIKLQQIYVDDWLELRPFYI